MRVTTPLFLAAAVALSTAAADARGADREPQIPDLEVETFTLANGLQVILHEDHSVPVVGVNLWYKVGSKDEKRGRTGFAHLFEHLMFQGSEHRDGEYFGPLEKLGANINGSTNSDRTNYYEVVPTNALELALWLEADRMGFLLPALTQKKLDNQRDVVKEERRQRVDNVPYGQSMEKMLEAMYPPDHPYHHSTIGSMADLSAASLEDVSAFFRTYYVPNNASLCLAGDINPAEARALVEKYFGPIPRGPDVAKPEPKVPTLDAPKTITMTDRVALARTQLVWPTVPLGHADEAALDVLAAVLGQLDTENRLYRAMLYDEQLAAQVGAFHGSQALSGTFGVSITARPGRGLDDLVERADAEIKRLQEEGPTADEVRKAQARGESGLILSLQSAQARADFFNRNNVQYGDPLAYKDELKALFAVTPEDVKRVAAKYLTANRIRLDVTPGAPTPRAPEVAVDPSQQAELKSPPVVAVRDTFDRTVMPEVGPAPDFAPPPAVRKTLSNGLELLVVERRGLPILTFNLVVKGGEVLAPEGKEGLAELTGSLISEGTETRSALELAGSLSKLGASLNSSGGLESGRVSLTTLTKHRDEALDLFADVILRPSFPPKELERLRFQKLNAILRRADSATGIANVVFAKLLYGADHPYGRTDTAESVRSITREDVVGFHKRIFAPKNAALIVVGDTTAEEIAGPIETALGSWNSDEAPKIEPPKPPASATKPGVYLVDKPSAAQSVLAAGLVGPPRSTPDYFPLVVMNAALGGQFSSRINLNLREDKGYTYGARSGFEFRQGPGPFEAGASVQTAVTDKALVELHKELTEVVGARPISSDELAFAKGRLILGFPGRFETTFGVAQALVDLVLYNLPADYFTTYQAKVEAVTEAEAARVAKQYLDPSALTILVVGDRSKVEEPLKALPFVSSITLLDPEGNPAKPAEAGDQR